MKSRHLFLNLLRASFALVVLAIAGCQTSNTVRSLTEFSHEFNPQHPRLKEMIGPGYEQMRLFQKSAFDTLALKWFVDPEFVPTLLTAQNAPIVERPEFWVESINLDDGTPEYRKYMLCAFFLRHLRPGESPYKLSTIEGTEEWFAAEETVFDNTGALGGYYFRPPDGKGGVYTYTPAFLPISNSATVTIRTSVEVPLETMVAVMRGDMSAPDDLFVVDIEVTGYNTAL